MTDKSASRKDIAPLRDALCADLQRHELRHRGVVGISLFVDHARFSCPVPLSPVGCVPTATGNPAAYRNTYMAFERFS